MSGYVDRRLASEARRWLTSSGYSTDPAILRAVARALSRDYADVGVIRTLLQVALGKAAA